jgi:hypothetical protein
MSASVAILHPAQRTGGPSDPSRFAGLFAALAEAGIHAEPAPYHDGAVAEVEAQLAGVSPYPESANGPLVEAVRGAVRGAER